MNLHDVRHHAVLLTLICSLCMQAGCSRQQGSGPGTPDAMPAMPVTVVTLAAQPVALTRELPGRTAAFRVAEVRPQVSGIVKQRLFTEGALVSAGQPLYQLDDATYRADHGMAKAALARAEAGLEAARLRANRSASLVKTGLVSA